MRSGEEDKYPNEHGLGSLPVLFAAQLPWITKLIYFSHSSTQRNIGQKILHTFYAVHLQCIVKGLEPVAATIKTLDQSINEDLKKKKQNLHHPLY